MLFQFKTWLPKIFFTAVLATSWVLVLNPDAHTHIRGLLHKDSRIVLSTAMGDLMSNGTLTQVVKIKTAKGIQLEIYGTPKNGIMPLLQVLELPDQHRDAFFQLNDQSTNLALDDVNGDGRIDILAPAFDNDLVSHLNIFSFNSDLKKFEIATVK